MLPKRELALGETSYALFTNGILPMMEIHFFSDLLALLYIRDALSALYLLQTVLACAHISSSLEFASEPDTSKHCASVAFIAVASHPIVCAEAC